MTEFLRGPLTRRAVVKTGALVAGSLIVACRHLTTRLSDVKDDSSERMPSPFAGYLEITPDDKIRFVTTRAESGQGIVAGFAVLLAEELDVDPSSIEVTFAGVNNRLPTLSDAEGSATGGSSSTRRFYQPVRRTAAAAKEMLVSAAAALWSVDVAECKVENGKVVHASSQRNASYGSLATAAALLPTPQNPTLKDAANYKYIGKANRRTDIPAKVTGTAIFGIDVKVEGMLSATIVHCPFVGGDLQSMNDAAARAHPGVKDVVKTPYGVIVIADTFWHASSAAKKLQLQWLATSSASSAAILAAHKQLVETRGTVASSTGDFEATMGTATTKVDAAYQAQYLPHTTLEPQNCTAWLKSDGTCEIWAPTQDPASAAGIAADVLGINVSQVKVNVTLLGGGFGRRLRQDYVAEAVYAAKAVPNQPVKLLWQRTEEFTHDLYRPASYAKMSAGLDAEGKPVAWLCHIASSSIYSWLEEKPSNLIQPETQTQVDSSSVEGCEKSDYGIANFRCEWSQHEPGVPVFWWRSVGHSQNAFFSESFIDECAKAANADPLEYRLKYLTSARQRAVLELARDKSGWATPPPAGTGRGVAIHSCFGSIVAQVVEVSVQTGTIYVDKVTVVVDCGTAVDSFLVHTQMESAIAQALGATLKQEITVNNGKVSQLSLNSCQPITLSEMPEVVTFIVPSTANPGGIGEPGVPPLAPAVANAVFALTGQRLRSLPLRLAPTA